MAPRRKRWRDARPGLIVIVVLAAIAIFTLTYARIGALRGPTLTVYLPVAEARNVMSGTDVWLAGKPVGAVRTVSFRDAAAPPEERILLELAILRDYQDLVREDSEADIRSGGTLLGAPVVNIAVGSPAARAVRDGDTLRRAAQRELADFTSQLAALGGEFSTIASNLQQLRASASGLEERISMIDRDRQQVMRLFTRSQVSDPLPRRRGSLQLLMADAELGPRLRRIRAGTDTILQALGTGQGTIARTRADTILPARIDALMAELRELSRLVEGGYGTAGRLVHDRALAQQIEALRNELQLLKEDASRWPERYVHF